MRDVNGKKLPAFPNIHSKWDKNSEYISLFPNVLLGVQKDHTFSVVLTPETKKTTNERFAIYYSNRETLGSEYSTLRKNNAIFWKGVFEEDIKVVEGMQKGRNGLFFDGGRFSPIMEEPTRIFHKWVTEHVEG
jgi:phenylpropionate dioxygenase-like ring-hydroxylating dioxygenase large terminal subunit